MASTKREITQTNVQNSDSSGHQIQHKEYVDDNLLPDADEIAKLYAIDPTIMDFLKETSKAEMEFRHGYYYERLDIAERKERGKRRINYLGMTFAFILLLVGMCFSAMLIYLGHTITGSIFSGATILSGVALFIGKSTDTTTPIKTNQPKQTPQ